MKVMFFAHDPGGANAIKPLIPHFDNPLVFAKGPALRILPNAKELPLNALSLFSPNFLVTGTSANDFTERNLWQEADTFLIPSMAILDSWVSYGIRFSSYGIKDLHLFKGVCEYLPNYICVMDDFAKMEMTKEGVPKDRIVPLGNPHFEAIAMAAEQALSQNHDRRVILFASEPFEDIYHKGAEQMAVRDLIKIAKPYEDVIVRIRKHPREPDEKYIDFLGSHVEMDTNTNPLVSIAQAEVVISVSSMMLIEALIFGKKIISYQPKSKNGKDDFILTRNSTLPFLQNIEALNTYFTQVMDGHVGKINNKITHHGIIHKIVSFIKERCNGHISD